ncbi:MAG: Na(+)-translocating NADH-quinone reductase subunit A [Bacteroidales bacterium]
MRNLYKIRKGIDIKLFGAAKSQITIFHSSTSAVVPDDFKWMLPKLLVEENTCVKVGTPLFCSKEDHRICIVSPVSGIIKQIVRGDKRKIERIEIESDHQFISEKIELCHELNRELLIEKLLAYGLWPFIRQRPFGIIANPDDSPKAIFISGFDSAPLAPDYGFMMQNQLQELQQGIDILKQLTEGKVHFSLPNKEKKHPFETLSNVEFHYFTGPHPAGNVGTQIHYIDPIKKGEIVWTVEPQLVAIIGKLFLYKSLEFKKIISFVGSSALNPQYYELSFGASVTKLVEEQIGQNNQRIISGNVLTGKKIDVTGYVGYYDQQITVIPEGGKRELFGWLYPGFDKWSFSHSYLSWLFPKKKFNFNTALQGGRRVMMMTGEYEKVFPFHILPMQLLKACVIEDIDMMEALGIYEVIGEDFALCEVVCPSKTECQEIIEQGLFLIKKEVI